jgi:transcriptional regulator with XRE-family HTH domain
MKNKIGEKLRELRLAKGKTQAEVAAAVGVRPSAIAMYERGERVPRDKTKIILAKYFGKTVNAIFFGA